MARARLHILSNHVSGLLIIFSALLKIVSSAILGVSHGDSTIESAPRSNQCTDSSAWIGTGPTSMDCIGAVQRLYSAEVKTFSDIDFEFLSAKVPARSLPAIRTPRKYTVGSCTLAIVMLNFFANGELPGGVEGPFASRDVTSFYEIWQAAQKIEATCLTKNGRVGWAAEGGREAVGVFLWATDSLENQRVPQGEPTLGAVTGLPGSFFNLSSGAR